MTRAVALVAVGLATIAAATGSTAPLGKLDGNTAAIQVLAVEISDFKPGKNKT